MDSVAVGTPPPAVQDDDDGPEGGAPSSQEEGELIRIVRTSHDDMTIREVALGQGLDPHSVLLANKMRVVRPFPPSTTIDSRLRRGTDVWLS